MASKGKNETKEGEKSKQKGKPSKTKDLVTGEPPPPEIPIPWVNPLPHMTGKEVFPPLAQGEHQFISILNSYGNPSLLTRLQRIENVLDDPYRPPIVIEHYDGSSCDCYFKNELTRRHDLCEKCDEIWRRWNWKHCPPHPVEVDPYESFLCVGDIDSHFQPTRGDIVIFHPIGAQSNVGLRAGWGFVLSYQGQRGFKFHPYDLVVRLGSFTNTKNVVDYIPYDKVEVRVLTKGKQWRFLGAQVALVREPSVTPLGPLQPPLGPLQPVAPMDQKDSTKSKKGKKEKKKDSKKDGSKETEGAEKPGKKKKGGKEKKKDQKSGKKDQNADGQESGLEIASIPEFTLDDIPDLFNIIPKVPDSQVPHPGETTFKPYQSSLTCKYKYNKPGMQCGIGEFLPQFGDIVIREPQAWMHDDWGDKKKRPKGSLVKWYKPAPWKRELKQGMLLLRPYVDRFTQLLDTIPHCEYAPVIWSQWGVVELYHFEGKVTPLVETQKPNGEPTNVEGELDGDKDKRDKKRGKKSQKGEKMNDKKAQQNEKNEDKKKEKNTKDNAKESKTSKKNVGEESKKNLEEQPRENKKTILDDLLWTYWGKSTHYFDEPFQFWALDKFCRKRHLREVQNLPHFDFFVEDSGVESDLEHTAKVEEVQQEEPKGKKAKGRTDKSKDKKDKKNEEGAPKKKKKS